MYSGAVRNETPPLLESLAKNGRCEWSGVDSGHRRRRGDGDEKNETLSSGAPEGSRFSGAFACAELLSDARVGGRGTHV